MTVGWVCLEENRRRLVNPISRLDNSLEGKPENSSLAGKPENSSLVDKPENSSLTDKLKNSSLADKPENSLGDNLNNSS